MTGLDVWARRMMKNISKKQNIHILALGNNHRLNQLILKFFFI